jgi:hypothetical protein
LSTSNINRSRETPGAQSAGLQARRGNPDKAGVGIIFAIKEVCLVSLLAYNDIHEETKILFISSLLALHTLPPFDVREDERSG